MINNCLEDGEREEAEKKLKNGTITLQITNSEGKTESKEVHNIEEWEKYSDWNKFILIPVLVTTDASSSNSYYGSSSNVISIQHDLKPGYARLKGVAKEAYKMLKATLYIQSIYSNLKLSLQTSEQNRNKRQVR